MRVEKGDFMEELCSLEEKLKRSRNRLIRSLQAFIGIFIVSLGMAHYRNKAWFTGKYKCDDGSISHIHRFDPWQAKNDITCSRSCIDGDCTEMYVHDYHTIRQDVERVEEFLDFKDPQNALLMSKHLVKTTRICERCRHIEKSERLEFCEFDTYTDDMCDYFVCKECGKIYVLDHIKIEQPVFLSEFHEEKRFVMTPKK